MRRKCHGFMGLLLTGVLLLAGCSAGGGQPPTEAVQEACRDDARLLTEQMAAGDYEAAAAHPYTLLMKSAINAAELEKIWAAMTDAYGAYREIYGYEHLLHSGSSHSVVVKMAFESQCVNWQVTYNGETISGLHYAPNEDDPANPGGVFASAYPTRELTFGDPDWQLPGTLTLPDGGEGPWPVVVIVQGSGPSDRDGRVSLQTPYRDIAEGLAQRGVASFRYDKRTYVYGSRMTGDITVWDETVADAAAAVEMLRQYADARFSRVLVAGHSLGGTLLPRIAEKAGADGYIALAAANTSLHRLMADQYAYIFNLDGEISGDEEKTLASVRAMADNVDALYEGRTFEAEELFNIPASYWLDLADYHPAEAMARMEGPLLMLQGEGDYQVPMTEFEAFREALDGRGNVTLMSYPGLTHLFTPAGDPPSPDDYAQAASFDSRVLDDMARWILALE